MPIAHSTRDTSIPPHLRDLQFDRQSLEVTVLGTGLQCNPVGWSLANIVCEGMSRETPSPYEDFAQALQTEYEEDCGVTFGKVPIAAIAKLSPLVDGEEKPIGRDAAQTIHQALVQQNS